MTFLFQKCTPNRAAWSKTWMNLHACMVCSEMVPCLYATILPFNPIKICQPIHSSRNYMQGWVRQGSSNFLANCKLDPPSFRPIYLQSAFYILYISLVLLSFVPHWLTSRYCELLALLSTHLQGVQMAKSCKEGMAANQRSGSEGSEGLVQNSVPARTFHRGISVKIYPSSFD